MLRNLTHEDIELIISEYKDIIPYTKQQLLEMLNNINYINIGNYDNDQLVSFLFSTKTETNIDIIFLFTIPSMRKQHKAMELINSLMSCRLPIMLEVNENNINAINLYKKIGFITIAKRVNYYGLQQNAITMKYDKPLSV